MNAYEKVKAACDACDLLYTGDQVYSGKEHTYVRVNAFDERVKLSGDDDVIETSTGMYVHLFLPYSEPFFSIKRKLQDALVKNGLNFPEMVANTIEGTTRHLTFQTADEERI